MSEVLQPSRCCDSDGAHLAQADGVVGHHVQHAEARERRDAHGPWYCWSRESSSAMIRALSVMAMAAGAWAMAAGAWAMAAGAWHIAGVPWLLMHASTTQCARTHLARSL
jgi:hypothetical protein